MGRFGNVFLAAVAVGAGLWVGGCGRLGDAMSSAPDCHPDLATVAALRQEPVLTRVPPGARGLLVKETVSCGWAGSAPPALGMLDSEVTGGDSDDVARFYTDLAGSSGWQTFGGGDQLYSGAKPDGTDCTWQLQVVSTAERTYHVRITYTPRDLRPTCL